MPVSGSKGDAENRFAVSERIAQVRLDISLWNARRYSATVDSYRLSRLRIVHADRNRLRDSVPDVIFASWLSGVSRVSRWPVNVLPPAPAETPHLKPWGPKQLDRQRETRSATESDEELLECNILIEGE